MTCRRHETVQVLLERGQARVPSKNSSNSLSSVPRSLVGEIVLAGLCLEILALALPLFSQVIFDKVVIHNSLSTLNVVASGMLVVTLFEAVLVYFFARHIHHLSATVDVFLTRPVMRKLLTLPLAHFESRSRGEIAAHVREIGEIRQFLSAASVTAVIDVAFMLLVLCLMALYSPMLAGVVAAAVPVLALLSAVLRPSVRKSYKQLNESKDRFESLIDEGLHNIATIKNMALESAWLRRWSDAHDTFVRHGLAAKHVAAVEETVLRVLQRVIVLAVLWLGATEVLLSTLSFGQLIACYMFSLRVLGPSTRIFQVGMGFFRIQEAKRQIDSLLEQPSEGKSLRSKHPFTPGEIEFDNVSFGYSSASVLNGVNLRIARGSAVGIVGQSGSGKSTLAKLLQRHLMPQQGQVRIGGVDLRKINLQALRRGVMLLTHEAALFQGSVRDNIVGREKERDEERIVRCCQLAGANVFIEEMPDGLDTMLDEKASKLSSGQRQRIALARALYARHEVMILDEATNALDAETELKVLNNLRSECSDKILLVITHREQVLSTVDWVIEVADGRLRTRPHSLLPREARVVGGGDRDG